jgi:hypothetical protein
VARNLDRLENDPVDAVTKSLKDATEDMAQGLKQQDVASFRDGASQLAALSREQETRRAITAALRNQLAELSESKAAVQQAQQSEASGQPSGQDGGNSVSTTQRESNNWGEGVTNQPLGKDPTEIATQREDVTLQGTRGEGPSERELVKTEDGSGEVMRQYGGLYGKYKRISEQVLRSEALPLGHRQTIRRYFESIRPTDTSDSPQDSSDTQP